MKTGLPLTLMQTALLPGTRTSWRSENWSFARVCGGLGSLLEGDRSSTLAPGELLFIPAGAVVCLQASRLSALALCHFEVCPAELPELFSVAEQCALAQAARHGRLAAQALPADGALARHFADLCGLRERQRALSLRRQMLRLAACVLQDSLKTPAEPMAQNAPNPNRRSRWG